MELPRTLHYKTSAGVVLMHKPVATIAYEYNGYVAIDSPPISVDKMTLYTPLVPLSGIGPRQRKTVSYVVGAPTINPSKTSVVNTSQ
jgi:hypothetical protein